MTTEGILGYRVTAGRPAELVDAVMRWVAEGDRCRWLACMNPHSYVVADGDPRYKEALVEADWLIPDGAGIVLASWWLGASIRERITGSDVFYGVMKALEERGGGSVFFLGSSEQTQNKIRTKLAVDYPRVRFAGYSPPFKASFTEDENDAMVAAVNSARPDVLWVGMTAPKQELWIHRNRHRLQVSFAGAIGAVFDFYTGRVSRSSPAFQKLGLEWLPRLVQQPRRLWKRTFISAPIFLWHAARYARAHGDRR